MEIKKCCFCKKELAIDMFDNSNKSKDGYESTCKQCKIKKHEYYERDKDEILQKCAEYRETHKEEKAARDKKYAQDHKEKRKQYQKEYRDAHKEKNAAYQKQYRKENKEKLDEYKKSSQVRYKVYKNNARHKDRNFDLTEDDFVKITSKPCVYCGEYSDTYNNEPFNGIDRVDSDLGYFLNNCVPCCATCNRMKMETPVNDWIGKMKQIINYFSPESLSI